MIASTPAPVPAPETDRTTRLTPLGQAAVAAIRLRRQLAALLDDADRRAIIRELLAVEPPPAA